MEVKSCGSLLKEGAKYLQLPDPDDGYLYELSKNYGLCVTLDKSEATISGRLSDDLFEMAQFEILPCSLPSGCANFEEVKRLSFFFATMKPTINLLNYSSPVKFDFYGDDYYYLNPDSTQSFNKKIMKNFIQDSRSYFFPSVVREPFTSIERQITTSLSRSREELSCTAEQITDLKCPPYFLFEFQAGGKTSTVIRNYQGIIETLGDVGGIREIVFTFFYLIYHFYNQSQAERLLAEKIFNFKPGVKIVKQQPLGISKIGAKNHENQPVAPNRSSKSDSHATDRDWSSADAIPHTVFKKAVGRIEQKLDVVSIVKELQTLDVIVRFLLKDYHRSLIPVVALNLDANEKKTDPLIDRQSPAIAPPIDQDTSHAQLQPAQKGLDPAQFNFDCRTSDLQGSYRQLLANHQTSIELLSNLAVPHGTVQQSTHGKSCLLNLQTDLDLLYVNALSEASWLPFSKPAPKRRPDPPVHRSQPDRTKKVYKIRDGSSNPPSSPSPDKKSAS